MIKTKLTALASAGALLAMTAPGAFAQNIAADYNNSAVSDGDGDIVAAFNLYDLAVGATLIQAAATNVGTAAAPAVGDRFTGYYQSYVTAHQLDGVVQNAPGLNTSGFGAGYEITVVAQFDEEVTSVSAGGYTSAITGGSASMYFDTTPDFNFVSDVGFTDGELLLSGSVVSGGAVSAPSLLSGFAQLDIVVNGLNSAIFEPDVATAQGIFTLDLRSNAVNGITAVGGRLAGVGDQLLGADGNLQLQAVPVPAAAWLFGSAVAGMVSLRRRKTAA